MVCTPFMVTTSQTLAGRGGRVNLEFFFILLVFVAGLFLAALSYMIKMQTSGNTGRTGSGRQTLTAPASLTTTFQGAATYRVILAG
jgi:hypothetical protein